MDNRIIRKLGLSKIDKDCTVERGRHVAFAFTKAGNILALETNRRATHGNVTEWTLHAEEFLIKKLIKLRARERFGTIDILVARWDKMGGWRFSKPCVRCELLMKSYGVRKISYTNQDGEHVSLK